jgi:ABC-type Mn2+/Zn2+ transport system ATPase subunit
MPVLLEVRDLAIGHAGRPLLSGINLSIARGDWWGIVGPNGAGKTTLVKTLLGIIPAHAGRIERSPRLTFGYVPQRGVIDDIFPLSALDVVVMGRYARIGPGRRVARADRALALAYMERVGIADLANKPFRSLSGGQKQRTLIARGLVPEPDVLVLDEPTDGMDLAGETGIMELIADLRRASGRTLLMISHSLSLVANYAKQLMLIHGHEGVFRTGTTDELLTGKTLEELYHVGVDVHTVDGRRFLFAHGPTEPGKEPPWKTS